MLFKGKKASPGKTKSSKFGTESFSIENLSAHDKRVAKERGRPSLETLGFGARTGITQKQLQLLTQASPAGR